MKYIVSGKIKGGAQFSVEIVAQSLNHARQIAMSDITSKQGLRINQVIIDDAKEIKEKK